MKQLGKKSGWLRLGIVFSILWFGVFGIVRISQYENGRERKLQHVIRICVDTQNMGGEDALKCIREAMPLDTEIKLRKEAKIKVLFEATATTILGWIGVLSTIGIVRWIKHGFDQQKVKAA